MSKITHNGHDVLRTTILRPYRKGSGPTFYLAVWDTGRRHARGTTMLGYCLKQGVETIFEGEDFSPSPMDADDSDACLAALLGFLTVRPGDTDNEYFASYTPRQMQFAEEHAEQLGYEATRRFGEDS